MTHDNARILHALREAPPLVQCLINSVVTNYTANALLAVGAAPVMADVPGEAAELAPHASAVLVNVGTPNGEQRDAMREAAATAHASATPWVLDPVGVGALTLRSEFARDLLELRPTVIRGNASEIMALVGEGAGGRGVDAADGVDAARTAAGRLAADIGAVVAVSGPIDLIVGPGDERRVSGGSELLTRVTGGGCSLGAVVAACVAVSDPFSGAVAAHTLYAAASERAAVGAGGPGSFAVRFLDALSTVTPDELAAR